MGEFTKEVLTVMVYMLELAILTAGGLGLLWIWYKLVDKFLG